MKKLRWMGWLFVMSAVVILATILVSCESSGDTATLTISNLTSEWLKIFVDTLPQQDSAPSSIQMIGVNTNTHLVAWEGQTVVGQVMVTPLAGQNITLKIYETHYTLE